MIQGYLLSLLSRQRTLLQERFDARYPHAWLVWEPGTRLRPQNPDELVAGKTKLPSRDRGMHPIGNDAVCFPVPVPTKEGNCLMVGRQLDSSIVIDDMSVSREHACLYFTGGQWQLDPLTGAQTMVEGVPLGEGIRAPLKNGFVILLGGVQLTFYERDKFIERLLLEEKRQALDQLR